MKFYWSIILLITFNTGYSQTFNDGLLEYTVIDGTNVSLTMYNNICPPSDVNIPETIENEMIIYTITSIGNRAFSNCDNLTSIIIPDTVTNIGNSAFVECLNLTSIKLPKNLISIGYNAFYRCVGITSFIIPESVTSIGTNAFNNTGLTSITIPGSLTSISNSAFRNCSLLTNVLISNGVKSIDGNAFSECPNLTSITIPKSVTNIGDLAFDGCERLTSINIPESVTSIGDFAFLGCFGLTSVIVNWEIPLVINPNVFFIVNIGNIPLTIPPGTTSLYQSAAVWQDFKLFNLGTQEIDLSDDLQVYPNPVNDLLNIKLKQGLELEKISIYNNLNQFVLSTKKLKINTSNLSSGMYFIEVETNQGKSAKKIIIE